MKQDALFIVTNAIDDALYGSNFWWDRLRRTQPPLNNLRREMTQTMNPKPRKKR